MRPGTGSPLCPQSVRSSAFRRLGQTRNLGGLRSSHRKPFRGLTFFVTKSFTTLRGFWLYATEPIQLSPNFMRTKPLVLSLLGVAAVSLMANDIEPSKEFYNAYRAGQTITLDGILNDWTGAPV